MGKWSHLQTLHQTSLLVAVKTCQSHAWLKFELYFFTLFVLLLSPRYLFSSAIPRVSESKSEFNNARMPPRWEEWAAAAAQLYEELFSRVKLLCEHCSVKSSWNKFSDELKRFEMIFTLEKWKRERKGRFWVSDLGRRGNSRGNREAHTREKWLRRSELNN